MKVAVYDAYVPRKSGGIMHFDVVVPEGLPYEKVQGWSYGIQTVGVISSREKLKR